MRMSEKCNKNNKHNNNSDNPLTSCRTDGRKNILINSKTANHRSMRILHPPNGGGADFNLIHQPF